MAGVWRGTSLLFFIAFLMPGAVGELHCIVTRNGSRTFYRVLNPPPPSELKGHQCDNGWNKGNTVLASNFDSNKSTLVLRHSSDSLEVSECLTDVSWTQDCWSKTAGQTSYAANCSTTCPDTLRGTSPTSTEEDGRSNIWIGPTFGILGLIGLALLIFLVCKFKKRCLGCFPAALVDICTNLGEGGMMTWCDPEKFSVSTAGILLIQSFPDFLGNYFPLDLSSALVLQMNMLLKENNWTKS